jgi:hypothetical protein
LEEVIGSGCVKSKHTMVDIVSETGDEYIEVFFLGVEIFQCEGSLKTLEIELNEVRGTSIREKAWEKLW